MAEPREAPEPERSGGHKQEAVLSRVELVEVFHEVLMEEKQEREERDARAE